ncbi:histidine kinase [Sphingobacterium sp. DR205]|uniref:sensor histidine kinase n=1 Tax=Sphingobacterium sp. DR205 TaxID=2713573 RepID=UPI0019CF8ECC|nr:histidine kinase [Sphingobacterium sp. DR205]
MKRTIIHIMFWSSLFAMYLVSYKRFDATYSWLLAVKELIVITSIFYFTSYFIIPKYLLKGRYTICLLWLAVIYTWWGLLTYLTCWGINSYINPSKRLQEYVDHVLKIGLSGLFNYSTFTFYLLDFIYFISFPLGIKLTKAILDIRNEKTQLELENLELDLSNVQLELAFLKAQINPHFLFNTINNIIFLVSVDPPRAEKSLTQLSGIMNYLVYESDKPVVSLEFEFAFLESYIELEKLRLSNKVRTVIYIETDSNDYFVVPLIIFPLIENAFKHGPMSSNKNAWVDIQVFAKDGGLNVNISNGYKRVDKPVGYVGGIGVDNVRKRLELNYPNQYNLEINETRECYTVRLELNLSSYTRNSTTKIVNYA